MSFRKSYGFFRQNLKTGQVEGYIENSFTMGWSETYVRAWFPYSYKTKDGVKTILGHRNPEEYLRNCLKNQKDKTYRYFIVRISGQSKKTSIRVNLARGKDKFTSRNKQFVVNYQAGRV